MSSLLFSGHLRTDIITFCIFRPSSFVIICTPVESGRLTAILPTQTCWSIGNIKKMEIFPMVCDVMCLLEVGLLLTANFVILSLVVFRHSSFQAFLDSSHGSLLNVLKGIWLDDTFRSGQSVAYLSTVRPVLSLE